MKEEYYNDTDYNSKLADQAEMEAERMKYHQQHELLKEAIRLYNLKEHPEDGRILVLSKFEIRRIK